MARGLCFGLPLLLPGIYVLLLAFILGCKYLLPAKQDLPVERIAGLRVPGPLLKKQEGHEALNRSPEYTGQSQTFNFEI